MIHPSAVIDPKAEIDPTAEIGPCAVIGGGVRVGPHTRVGPHVYLTGATGIGAHNRIHAGCVLGEAPQDLKYKQEPTHLEIGSHNIFREHVTVHRSNSPAEATRIGSENFFMVNSHVGHNCQIGDQIILVNGALLGGHVTVANGALISGNCLVHQFVRIGALALMQGGAGISKDLPPFTVARGVNQICGLNTVGLRRAGFSSQQRQQLRRLYHLLFRRQRQESKIDQARTEFPDGPARELIEFIASSRRGYCMDASLGELGGVRSESEK